MKNKKVLIVKKRGLSVVSMLSMLIKTYFKNVSEVFCVESLGECRILLDDIFLKLVIVDTSVAGPSFVEEVKRIRGDFIKIVCLSGDDRMKDVMIEAGCDGFLALIGQVGNEEIIKTIKPFLA